MTHLSIMKKTRLLLSACTFLSVTTISFPAESGSDSIVDQPVESITLDELKSTVHFLASDELQGRNTDSQGNRVTSRYLAHQFEMMGLEPAGDDGTYFQHVALSEGGLTEANNFSLTVGDATLSEAVLMDDFFPISLSAGGVVEADVVFAGYGISAPELGYNDYEGIQVEGKAVLILAGEPGQDDPESVFDGIIPSKYSETSRKAATAARLGASALLIARLDRDGNLSGLARREWPEQERPYRQYDLEAWVNFVPALYVSKSFLSSVLGDRLSLDDVKSKIDAGFVPQSTVLDGVRVSLQVDISRTTTEVRNVLALLPGSDPVLKDEVVILSAHLDHVGSRGEAIYNGADDDASGTAGVLEVAEAMAISSFKPSRSVLFALWNAEEKGLLGSRYYVESPRFPIENTAALFQLDMIGRNQEVPDSLSEHFKGLSTPTGEENQNTLHVVGYSKSKDLSDLVRASNAATGLDLLFELDSHPLQLIRRSDNWPFLSEGVPSVFFTTGLHPDYHSANDTADKINYPKLHRIVRLTYFCVWQAANAPDRPRLGAGG